MYRCKVVFAFLPAETGSIDSIWELIPEGKNRDYRSGMSMPIGGRKFVSCNCTSELNRLLFMLIGKNDPLCGFYYRRDGGGVYLEFPTNKVYKVESIYDCADSQQMYDTVNFLITREGHVGTHINTDFAVALKAQIDANKQRQKNANDLLAGL
jgi:hypothetical protein